jgi:peptide/nickel transport system substrate-binding protein
MLRMKLRFALSLALLFIVVMPAVPSGGRAETADEYKTGVVHGLLAGDIRNLDPALAWVSVESPIITVVMEGLVDYPNGTISTEFVPALAERWEVSDDGLIYTFYLRKGVQWQGGYGEFTAEDVKFTLDRYRDPAVSAWVNEYANIKNVEIVDPYIVKVELTYLDPFFLGKIATDAMSGSVMTCRNAFEDKGSEYMRLHPIGTGPFQFEEYRPQDRVILRRFDDHWNGKAKLETLTFVFMPNANSREMALRTGEIDTMKASADGRVLDRLVRDGFILDAFGPEIVWWLHIDATQRPFNDIRVRQAIIHALNPIEEKIMIGPTANVSDSLMPDTYFGAANAANFPTGTYGYDLEKAKKLMTEAGYADGFSTEMIITEREDYRSQMIIIQEQLKKIGINVNLNVVDHTRYHSQIRTGINPLVLFGEISYPNTEIFLLRFFKAGGITNFSKFDNPEFEALLERIAQEKDLSTRRQLLIDAQLMIAENALIGPTIYTKQPLIRSPKVDLGYELKSSLVLNYRFLKDSTVRK